MYCKDFYLVSETCTKGDEVKRLETAMTECKLREACLAVLQLTAKDGNNEFSVTTTNKDRYTCDAGAHLYALCPETTDFNETDNFQNTDSIFKYTLAQKLRIEGNLIFIFCSSFGKQSYNVS